MQIAPHLEPPGQLGHQGRLDQAAFVVFGFVPGVGEEDVHTIQACERQHVVNHLDRIVGADADVGQVVLTNALEQGANAGFMDLAAQEARVGQHRRYVGRGLAHAKADFQHGSPRGGCEHRLKVDSQWLVRNQKFWPQFFEGFGLADVLDYALYDGLDRLIVGEVHLDGITKMLETMITTDGSMSTYHAFSTDQAGERMKLGLQIETPGASAETAASFVRQAVELVVVSEKIGANRRVTQITEIDWRASSGADRLSGSDLFTYNREKGTHQGGGRSPDPQGRIIRKGEKYGVEFPHNWFVDSEELKNFRLG